MAMRMLVAGVMPCPYMSMPASKPISMVTLSIAEAPLIWETLRWERLELEELGLKLELELELTSAEDSDGLASAVAEADAFWSCCSSWSSVAPGLTEGSRVPESVAASVNGEKGGRGGLCASRSRGALADMAASFG